MRVTTTSGPVKLVVGGVNSNTNISFTVPAPHINSLSPAAGGIGNTVAFNGTGFQATRGAGGNGVSFNILQNSRRVEPPLSMEEICNTVQEYYKQCLIQNLQTSQYAPNRSIAGLELKSPWCAVEHRVIDCGVPLPFTGEFEVVIMIADATEEMHGSDRVPDLRRLRCEPWLDRQLFN